MSNVELSTIPDSDLDIETLQGLVKNFGEQHDVDVSLKTMTWGMAWAELLNFASHGKGSDVSHLGDTWVSSLATMNALRPFQPDEIEAVGGSKKFIPAVWESAMLFDDEHVWSLPWTGYMYVVCYRKDLLTQIGIDESKAFGTLESFSETVAKLTNSTLDIPWLHPYVPPPYSDLVHIAASWVWSMGGDFIDKEGSQVVFDSPETLKGLKYWLDIYRNVPEMFKSLDWSQSVQLFTQGRAAAVVTDIRTASSFFDGRGSQQMRDNLGVATLTDVPWLGGGSYVIWQHTLGHPEREQAAVELVKYLVSYEAEVAWCRSVHSMPARVDTIETIYPAGNPLREVVSLAIQEGRAYHNVPLWRRVEFQLAQELGACVHEARENLETPLESILERRLVPLAKRLNLTLGN